MTTDRAGFSPGWVEDGWRDARHAVRALRRTPGFTAVALLTLALGIGANTAIFSIVNGVLLRPLGYPDPGQLLRFTSRFPGIDISALSTPEYVEFRDSNRSFAHVGAFAIGGTFGNGNGAWTGAVNLTAGDRALRVRAALVDEHLFQVLGVEPAQGRLFGPGETAAPGGAGGPPLAILSHELWQAAFGGQRLVGRTVEVDGRAHEVIGIMPPGVDLVDHRPEIWLPLGVHPAITRQRGLHILSVVGRLKAGVAPKSAAAELDTFLDDWSARTGSKGSHVPVRRPSALGEHDLRMQPLHEAMVGDAGRAVWVLQAAVGLVLLIACANLANLIMARSESRRGELALREALGATRGRLLRQLMAEGMLLALAGGIVGAWLARAVVQGVVVAFPTSLPRTSEIVLDARVLLFTLALSLAAGVIFGLAPLARRRAQDLSTALKEAADRATAGGGRRRFRRALVVAEIALAVVLVIGAGLLAGTVFNLARVDAGFDRSRLVTFSVTLPPSTEYAGGRVRAYQRLLDALRNEPGIDAASAMSDLPLHRVVQGYGTQAENYVNQNGEPIVVVDYYQFVMSDYFRTMGIPIVAGRAFDASDTTSGGRSVVINETLAQRLWPGQDPVGRRLGPNLTVVIGTVINPWHTVVGVAKDVREGGVDRPPGTEVYLFVDQPGPPVDGTREPYVLTAPRVLEIVLRTPLPSAALTPAIQRAVHRVDPAVPVARLRDMEEVFADSIRRPRLLAQLLAWFGGLAILLAGVGTYGVLAYMVAERRREIGVRMAMGATRGGVLAHVMRQGLALSAVGIVLGVAGALALNRLFASLLFAVDPTDPVTFAAVATSMAVVAGAACALPAWRAARLSPMVAMRDEPLSMWRTARVTLRAAVGHLTADSGRPDVASVTFISELTGVVQGAASFPAALAMALDALRERIGARSITLLERTAAGDYADGEGTIPARGVLVARLQSYPHPLPITADDLRAWRRWSTELRPEHAAELERLADADVRVAVALRARREVVGILLVGAPEGRDSYGAAERQLLGGAAEVLALMVENARMNARALEQEKVRRDLALAADVQRRLLPPRPPATANVRLAAYTLPARTIGGDFYDFVSLPGGCIGVAVADIAGKGIAAALLTSVVQANLRVIAADSDISAAQLAAKMNGFLHRSTGGNGYATFFYAQFDGDGRALRYVNAGHNPPYLVRRAAGGVETTELTAGGMVLGLFPDVGYDAAAVGLCPGDLLVAFTDGVTEARRADDEEFGEDRLKELLRGAVGMPADDVVALLAERLRAWIAGAEQHDDLTIVVAAVT